MGVKNILKHTSTGRQLTPQTEQSHPKQVQNNAGGFSFPVDDWRRMERFLILGSDNGTYYVSEKKITQDAAKAVQRCIDADGAKAVEMIVDVSTNGRAYRNSPAIYALALAASATAPETRKLALNSLAKVCRIGTHLFEFLTAAVSKEEGGTRSMRGWGPSLRKAVSAWYLDREPNDLALQLLKYRQREGWNHHSVFHLAHTKAPDAERNQLFRLAKSLASEHKDKAVAYEGSIGLVQDFLQLQDGASLKSVLTVIRGSINRVTWEMIPSEHLGNAEVWEALLQAGMPITALIRNLGRMTANGLLEAGKGKLSTKGKFNAIEAVTTALNDVDQLRKGRVHPVQVLAALLTYKSGHGGKGSLTWNPVAEVTSALDKAFYSCFKAVEPTGKSFMYGLDVSGSMGSPNLMDIPGMTPRVGSAAMAMACARVEAKHAFVGFSNTLVPVPITADQKLEQVISTIEKIPMGGTDCALPIKFARERKLEVDTFVVLTDSETWAGGGGGFQGRSTGSNSGHVHEQLELYRKQMGRAAKLVIVGMVSNDMSCANPDDAGQLDVTGFDSSVPTLISNFAKSA